MARAGEVNRAKAASTGRDNSEVTFAGLRTWALWGAAETYCN